MMELIPAERLAQLLNIETEAKALFKLLLQYNPRYPMGPGQYRNFAAIMERLGPALHWTGVPFERQE